MARTNGRRRYNNRMRYRKKRSNNRKNKTTVSVSRTIGFPDRMVTKLRFGASTASSSIGDNFVFSGNNARNVPLTFSPVSAINFSQWSLMYSRFMVKSSSIRVRVVNAGNNAVTSPFSFILYPSSESGGSGIPIDQAVSQPYAKQRLVGTSNGNGVTVLKHYMSTKKITGYKYLDVSDLAGAYNQSPSQQWYWNVQLNPLDAISNLAVYVFVDIVFYVEFFDRFLNTNDLTPH